MGETVDLLTYVEVSISCRDLAPLDDAKKPNPIVLTFLKLDESSEWKEVDRTEVIKEESNPNFVRKIVLEFRFEVQRRLKFAVFNFDPCASYFSEKYFIGGCEATLGEIVSNRNLSRHLTGGPCKDNGYIILSAEEVSTFRDEITLDLYACNLDRKDIFGTSDPFLTLYKVNKDNSRVPILKTDVIKNNLNPHWKPITVPTRLLCCGDYDRPILISCVDWNKSGKEDLIGETVITINTIRQAQRGEHLCWPLIHPKKAKRKNYQHSGMLYLSSARLEKVPTFLEYVQGGTEFCCCIAIDFTASNGCPSVPGTLHYCDGEKMSQYAVALQAVGEIIADYDSDNLFPAFGFGAHIPAISCVSHNFPLNGVPDNPYCRGISGVMKAYHHALRTVTLHGPTNFAPIINKVANIARQNDDGSQYYILLILTDGIICDMPATKAAIVNASTLPLSIIIVGVGAADFEAMEELDGDEIRLAFRGKYAERDIVQFVPLREFHNSPTMAATKRELARAVLAEIPDQLVGFMRAKGIKPGEFEKKDLCIPELDEVNGGSPAKSATNETPGPFASSNARVSLSPPTSSCSSTLPCETAMGNGGCTRPVENNCHQKTSSNNNSHNHNALNSHQWPKSSIKTH